MFLAFACKSIFQYLNYIIFLCNDKWFEGEEALHWLLMLYTVQTCICITFTLCLAVHFIYE